MNSNNNKSEKISGKSSDEVERLSGVSGEHKIISKIYDMIQTANSKIIITCTLNDLLYISKTSLMTIILSTVKKGVPIHIVTEEPTKTQLEMLSQFNVTEIKIGNLFTKTLTIVGNTGMLLSSTLCKNILSHQKSAYFTEATFKINEIFSLCDLMLNKSQKLHQDSLPLSNQ